MTTESTALTDVVRFGRLEQRGVLLGLSGVQVAMLGTAVGIAVAAEYAAGVTGVLTVTPLCGSLSAAALVSVRERPIVAWLPILAHWFSRRMLRATAHRTRPIVDPDPDALALPGIPGRLTVIAAPDFEAGLIVDRRTATVTAVAELNGRGFLLADPGTQQRQVAAWARVLASLCQQPTVVRAQLLHRSLPGGVATVRRWWAQHALADAPWASRVVAELIADAEQHSLRHECLLAVALRVPRGLRRRLPPSAVETVEQQLATLADALSAADLDVHAWLGRRDLHRVLRGAYDPAGAARAEDAQPGGGLIGPMGIDEDWSYVRTDSAYHAVYWISEWPRSDVYPGFLRPLLIAPGQSRAFTLLAEPVPAAKALREIRRAKAEQLADAAQRERIGRVEDETTRTRRTIWPAGSPNSSPGTATCGSSGCSRSPPTRRATSNRRVRRPRAPPRRPCVNCAAWSANRDRRTPWPCCPWPGDCRDPGYCCHAGSDPVLVPPTAVPDVAAGAAAGPPGQLGHSRWRLPVPRRQSMQQWRVHRDRRDDRRAVLLRPVGAVRGRGSDQPQHAAGRSDRAGQVGVGEVAGRAVGRRRAPRLRPRGPEGRMGTGRREGRRVRGTPRLGAGDPAEPARPPARGHRRSGTPSAGPRPCTVGGCGCSPRSPRPPSAGTCAPPSTPRWTPQLPRRAARRLCRWCPR